MGLIKRLIALDDVQKILQQPKWLQHGSLLLIILTVSLVSGYFTLTPKWQQLDALHLQLSEQTQALNQIQQKWHALPNQQNLSDDITQFIQLINHINQQIDHSSFFERVITECLQQSGSQLIKFQQMSQTQESQINTQRWQLQLEGDYFQLIEFLSLLKHALSTIHFESIDLEKTQQNLQLTTMVSIYLPKY